jgi:hypothetical protein
MPYRLGLVALFVLSAPLHAGDNKLSARLRSPIGTLLQRGGDKGWQTPMLYDAVPASVQLVALPGARANLEIQEGDLRLILAGNLPEFSSTPVLESAVTLAHPAAGVDLEFFLDRGRVLIENHKENGPARVRARIHKKSLDFELLDKKSVVALELFSRWPAGAPFFKKPKADHKPVGELIFLVAKGKAVLELNNQKQPLGAPILYRFDTLRGVEGPLPLKKIPDWLLPKEDQPEKVRNLQAAVEKLRRGIADKGLKTTIASAGESTESSVREVAAYSGTAVDHPAAGIAALKDVRSKEVRAAGVQALMHYAGRGSAEDVKLYEALIAGKLKVGEAAIVMELLHGFGAEARARPEIYDTLITYLQSDQLAVRELAAWNLYRLVPQGKSIAYDAAAPVEERARAQAAWRKLIPEGQVPKTAN